MTIYELKPKFQSLLRPLVKRIHEMGITPNQITIFTCLLSVIFGSYIFLSSNQIFYLLPIFFFVRMALNAIDGMLAKEFNMQTKLGAVLNELTDVLSDGVLYYSFIRLEFINSNLLLAIIFLSCLSELTGLTALLNKKERQFQGPMGKSDRAFAFSIVAILVSLKIENVSLHLIILGIIFILLLKTIYNRIINSI
jgi:CDP-diacylglycerol--glycerol-3-phosphate 3-phosphatidyltransferase